MAKICEERVVANWARKLFQDWSFQGCSGKAPWLARTCGDQRPLFLVKMKLLLICALRMDELVVLFAGRLSDVGDWFSCDIKDTFTFSWLLKLFCIFILTFITNPNQWTSARKYVDWHQGNQKCVTSKWLNVYFCDSLLLVNHNIVWFFNHRYPLNESCSVENNFREKGASHYKLFCALKLFYLHLMAKWQWCPEKEAKIICCLHQTKWNDILYKRENEAMLN